MNEEYIWDEDSRLATEAVPPGAQPERVAITASILVLARRDGRPSLLLHNPHPDSWNTWLPPYDSLQMGVPDADARGDVFGAIALKLKQLRAEHDQQYRVEVLNPLVSRFASAGSTVSSEPLFEDYALRYSLTALVWTAYAFNHHTVVTSGEAPVPSATWLGLDGNELDEVITSGELVGRKVSEGILHILRDRSRVDQLRALL